MSTENGTRERVLILGLGRSGTAAARLLVRLGAEVVAYDRNPDAGAGLEGITRLSGSELPDFEGFTRVVQSPGVPVTADLRIVPEVELAAQHLGAPLIGVTGTNGKSTCTALIGEMLERSGLKAATGGNLGVPLSELVGEPVDRVVAELSSFQLEHAGNLPTAVAVLLNLAPDHLDRHGSLEAYGAAKAKLAELQGAEGTLVYKVDDAWARGVASRSRAHRLGFSADRVLSQGAFLKDGQLELALEDRTVLRVPLGALSRAARSPVDNALAASAAAHASGATPEGIRAALEHFEGLPHRASLVCSRSGVRYVNDSKATNPAAAVRSLLACHDPIVWIAGGRGKGLDFTPLAMAVGRVRAAVLYGEAGPEIARVLGGRCPVTRVIGFDDAFNAASRRACSGDIVLLAPACASQDQFRSFEERGTRFSDLARDLDADGREAMC